MGLRLFGSSSSLDKADPCNNDSVSNSVNPDPSNYTILNFEVVNGFLIIFIKYHDCTNYEGVKILLFNNDVTIEKLKSQRKIDPHFSENKNYYSPIARFEPTEEGFGIAKILCENIVKYRFNEFRRRY